MVARILTLLEHHHDMQPIVETLEQYGYSVFQASEYHDAMEILRVQEVDLIIGDVHLQNGGSIFDFLRWVKGDPQLRDIPFICFSSEPKEVAKYLSDGVRTAARALGAARYITMEVFDEDAFRAEIDWLIPAEQAGNYYADHPGVDQAADGDGNGDNKTVISIVPKK